jgi:hypothetical protein
MEQAQKAGQWAEKYLSIVTWINQFWFVRWDVMLYEHKARRLCNEGRNLDLA